MTEENSRGSVKRFAVVSLDELEWPKPRIPTHRFRLFIAADTLSSTVDELSAFAEAALEAGMVYFCAWGPGCERFHDIVDETLVEDELFRQHRFAGPTPQDSVMTTWHSTDTLDQALDFFVTCALPTDGFTRDSQFWLAICVGNLDWANAANSFLTEARFIS